MEHDPIDEGFAAALRQAQSENYLGNPDVVNTLLRRLVLFAHDAAQSATDGDAWGKAVNVNAAELAAIFTGHNPDYAPVPTWNTDAQMLAQMQTVGARDADAQDAVRGALLGLVSQFFDVLNASTSEEEATPKLDRLFDRYTRFFLGTAASR